MGVRWRRHLRGPGVEGLGDDVIEGHAVEVPAHDERAGRGPQLLGVSPGEGLAVERSNGLLGTTEKAGIGGPLRIDEGREEALDPAPRDRPSSA